MEKNLKHISKFMSLVLRHRPEEIGLQLDENGWADLQELIIKLNSKGANVDEATIQLVVDTNEKKRFAFNDDKTKIRANQGHSIKVDLQLSPATPPDVLYHGTALHVIASIMKNGLLKQNRHHVHLTASKETAVSVGARHGKPVVLEIDAARMVAEGFEFYITDNDVWLVEIVLPEYIISG
ncbi:MAG: RNA 2'-phosphotransferase [Pseudobacter sp.]|uniref:RNA 2'-phosphotransferase n=1 Tax=Pseudobacter sp. TaxID=2045420 RepID=UPI003F80F263